MAEIFQYLVVFSLAVWTARLAITKGRNGWTWGGAALILGLLPWHLIGVIPVLALMFVKAPVESTETRKVPFACTRCNKSYSEGQHFCTGCGWDLHQTYAPEKAIENQSTPNQPHISTNVDSIGVSQAPETHLPHVEPPPPVTAPQDVTVANEMSAPASEEPCEEPAEQHVPWGTYAVGEAPTAAVMVSRGIQRFSEDKFQEAIDQFTKAIVLDADYAEAWERRSEAYARLGRQQQAEDDRRHLQELDPSSSTS